MKKHETVENQKDNPYRDFVTTIPKEFWDDLELSHKTN